MKRSLHIGINDYPGTNSDLNGCVNDALDWKEALHKFGFEWQDVLLNEKAHLKAETDAIADIVDATKSNDTCVITNSSHGSWLYNTGGNDEIDGRDEALCPYDFQENGLLTDDYLYSIFSNAHPGAKIIVISDSCHSGSVTKMATREDGPFANEPWKFQKVRFLPPSFHLTEDGWVTTLKNKFGTEPKEIPLSSKIKQKNIVEKKDLALLLAGCADNEYSYDAYFNQRANGAFTYVALWTLKKLTPNHTYLDWYNLIRKYLPHNEYPQTPQICGTDDQQLWKIFE